MAKARSKRSKKRSFQGNRYSQKDETTSVSSESVLNVSASSKKLKDSSLLLDEPVSNHLTGNRIIDLSILISIFSSLCCPSCFDIGLSLNEDSRYGLCSNFSLNCKSCDFVKAFSTTPKVNNNSSLNKLIVLGLRLIGKGFSAGQKLFFTLGLPYISKCTFRLQELSLLNCLETCALDNMTTACLEVKNFKGKTENELVTCGISVDGTWQRRGYSSLNGCTSAISIDTGKVLDVETMSKFCRICKTRSSRYSSSHKQHKCLNHKGSSGSMEVVGVSRIFARSESLHGLQYKEYYGDGDSKGYEEVKNTYGVNSVKKLECIGHVQKRVGSRLRKLKKNKKGLNGKGKMTDKFIDKLQNYYGIAIRSNVGDLQGMQSAVIAAFFHCCSGYDNQMHGQCQRGPDSWCAYQRAAFNGDAYSEKRVALPNSIVNAIKPTYMQLCDTKLLEKCIHGLTQNSNESFNGVIWNIVTKDIFVEIQTLRLGVYLAVLLFNSGYAGLFPLFEKLCVPDVQNVKQNFLRLDKCRIKDAERHFKPETKLARKKRRTSRKVCASKNELKEGVTYKYGGF